MPWKIPPDTSVAIPTSAKGREWRTAGKGAVVGAAKRAERHSGMDLLLAYVVGADLRCVSNPDFVLSMRNAFCIVPYRPPAPAAVAPATIKATDQAMGHGNMETAARFPHFHTPDGGDGELARPSDCAPPTIHLVQNPGQVTGGGLADSLWRLYLWNP
jgi:hypothetical protein